MRRTALVTGASQGIGRALVSELITRGVTVFATGRDPARLEGVLAETGALGRAFDLAEPNAVKALYRAAREALGDAPLWLVNNAGFNSRKAPVMETSEDEIDALYAVNLRAPVALCQESLKDMTERGSGHIVNVISTVVHHGCEHTGLYSAMKHGLHGFTKVIVKEARPFGVKVTAVYPGGTDTAFRKNPRPDYLRPESAAHMIADTLFAPSDVVVHELTFRPLVETNF